jgi:hypothetical protein
VWGGLPSAAQLPGTGRREVEGAAPYHPLEPPGLHLFAAGGRKVASWKKARNVPSVDPDIDACNAKSGDARTTCWENLDKKLMTQVVPWVPYLWPNNVFIIGPKVTHWNYDQFTDGPAYSSVAMK